MKAIARTPLDAIRAQEEEEKRSKETIVQLEASNATLVYELMMKDAAISNLESQHSSLESQHSSLLYELMMKGVL